jgi:hypothetical protein
MNYAETILPEFDREMANTRNRVVQSLPAAKRSDTRRHPQQPE